MTHADLDSSTPFRPLISGANVYALLIRLFAEAQPRGCTSCRVPQPFAGPSAGSGEGYWFMPTPEPCAFGCAPVLSELWARLTTQYRIEPPGREQVLWKNGVRVTAKAE